MQILITNTKGGCGKSTLTACLAEILDADIVDHDPQGTLTINAKYTGRFKPVDLKMASKKYIIHDTPPYNNTTTNSLIKEADLILIPTKLTYPDLIALSTLASKIVKLKMASKAVLVLNEVRHQNKKLNEEVREMFAKEFSVLKIAKTEIPNWLPFSQVLAKPLGDRERAKIRELATELNI